MVTEVEQYPRNIKRKLEALQHRADYLAAQPDTGGIRLELEVEALEWAMEMLDDRVEEIGEYSERLERIFIRVLERRRDYLDKRPKAERRSWDGAELAALHWAIGELKEPEEI